MSMAEELVLGMMDEMFDDIYPGDNYECPDTITYWNSKNGPIKLTDMSDQHLTRTIQFLERQIDGTKHDEFRYNNINAMKSELERRKNLSLTDHNATEREKKKS